MFHYDRGLKLTASDLAVDLRRRQPRGFISHAHADHIARHELVYCTPATARLLEWRCGKQRLVEMPYRQPYALGETRITTFPAGHILGSAMLLAETAEGSLLYTGDFRLGDSLTAEKAELPRADVLVMESTYGDPGYRLPPRATIAAQLVEIVQSALQQGETPVIHAYVLGKSQEVTAILTQAGIGVMQHPLVHDISRIYTKTGVQLGDYVLYNGTPLPGHALIVPPTHQRTYRVAGLKKVRTIAVTGWALNPHGRYHLRVDHALPFSDHADFDELLACVEQVAPRIVLCTHGPVSFVDQLRERGINAHLLDERAHALASCLTAT